LISTKKKKRFIFQFKKLAKIVKKMLIADMCGCVHFYGGTEQGCQIFIEAKYQNGGK
jgi:hypothetical protein